MFYKLFSVIMFVANLCVHEMNEWLNERNAPARSLWRYLSTRVMSSLEMCGIGPVQCRSCLSLFQPTRYMAGALMWWIDILGSTSSERDLLFCASANLFAGEWWGHVKRGLFCKFQALFCTWHHYKKEKKSPLLSPRSDFNREMWL